MLHSHKVIVSLLTVLFLQATICKSKIQPNSAKSSAKGGPSVVQNCYGFSSAQSLYIVNRLTQITKKLEELDKKLNSCIGTSSKCKTGNGFQLNKLRCFVNKGNCKLTLERDSSDNTGYYASVFEYAF